jgi:hypothetical protein
VEPELPWQLSPEQQSVEVEQTPFRGWQTAGARHVPPVQMPEQHRLPLVQAALSARHELSGLRQAKLPVGSVVQDVPSQQLEARGVQGPPMPTQVAR